MPCLDEVRERVTRCQRQLELNFASPWRSLGLSALPADFHYFISLSFLLRSHSDTNGRFNSIRWRSISSYRKSCFHASSPGAANSEAVGAVPRPFTSNLTKLDAATEPVPQPYRRLTVLVASVSHEQCQAWKNGVPCVRRRGETGRKLAGHFSAMLQT